MAVEKDEVRSPHSVRRFLADPKELPYGGSGPALLLRIERRDSELCDGERRLRGRTALAVSSTDRLRRRRLPCTGWYVPWYHVLSGPCPPNSPSFLDFGHTRS